MQQQLLSEGREFERSLPFYIHFFKQLNWEINLESSRALAACFNTPLSRIQIAATHTLFIFLPSQQLSLPIIFEIGIYLSLHQLISSSINMNNRDLPDPRRVYTPFTRHTGQRPGQYRYQHAGRGANELEAAHVLAALSDPGSYLPLPTNPGVAPAGPGENVRSNSFYTFQLHDLFDYL